MDYIKSYCDYLTGFKMQSSNTIKGVKTDTNQFLNFANKDCKDITIGDVILFISSLSCTVGTKNRKLYNIKGFMTYLSSVLKIMDVLDFTSINVGHNKQEKKLPKFIEADDIKHLLSCVTDKRDLAIMTLFLNTGLRLSELVSLDRTQIKDEQLVIIGKGSKERTVYMNKNVTDTIQAYTKKRKDKELALFLNRYGNRLGERGVQKVVDKYLKQANLKGKGISVHALRHTFATRLLESGVDIATISQLLGHSSITTTTIYAKVKNETMKTAINKLTY